MYRQILETIDGIGIYPVISLIIFFVFFAAMVVWLLKADNNYLERMGRLPLDQSETNKNFTGDNNEI
jgi:cbb3-type cytochrome oxidase subunit 3